MFSSIKNLNVYREDIESAYGGKVYGIKRNFKKESQSKMSVHTQNQSVTTFQNAYVVTSANNSATSIPTNVRLGDYKFPFSDKVKGNWYFSHIDYVNDSAKTKSGEPAIEVFYTIIDQEVCYKIAAGIIKGKATNEAHHIRQLYPKGKYRYQALIDSVEESLGRPITCSTDFYGITEWVNLEYGNYSIGGFTKRDPISWKEVQEYFINSIQQKNMTINSYVDDEITENDNEYACSSTCDDTMNTNIAENHDDYDDEFDDFLSDEDWD